MLIFNIFLVNYIVSALPQNRIYNWTITNFTASYDGVLRNVIGINNKPGHDNPIEIILGDTILVNVTNGLNVPTSLHWHGMRQNGTQEMDGAYGTTQCGISPGKSILYKFTPSETGTYWWHGHYGAQYVDGLRGPLIIRNTNEVHASLYDEEIIIQLTDWYHKQSEVLASNFLNSDINPDGDEPVWETSLMNGKGNFNCNKTNLICNKDQPVTNFKFVSGKRYRIRLINMAAFAAYEFSIDNHLMRIIEVDGVDTQLSDTFNSLRINVAQRYSVIVTADQNIGNFWIRAKSLFMNPWTSLPKGQFPKGFNPNVLGIITYSNSILDIPLTQPPNPVIRLNEMKLVPYKFQQINSIPYLSFLIQFGVYNTPQDPVVKAYVSINDGEYHSYKIPDIPLLFDIARGTPLSNLSVNLNSISIPGNKLIEIKLINADAGEHPFHLHGHTPFIVGRGNTKSPYDKTPIKVVNPLRRDTFTIPACNVDSNEECIDVGYTTIRFISDNPGVWLLHCHIEWHIQSGLTMSIIENPDLIKKKGLVGFSKEFTKACNLI